MLFPIKMCTLKIVLKNCLPHENYIFILYCRIPGTCYEFYFSKAYFVQKIYNFSNNARIFKEQLFCPSHKYIVYYWQKM